jgi:hypothetical protein
VLMRGATSKWQLAKPYRGFTRMVADQEEEN